MSENAFAAYGRSTLKLPSFGLQHHFTRESINCYSAS